MEIGINNEEGLIISCLLQFLTFTISPIMEIYLKKKKTWSANT